MKEYGMTLLTVYRHLPKMAAVIERTVDKRAVSSMRTGRKSTLEQLEELCALIAEKEFYRELAVKLKEVLNSLSEEDRLLLEYKYFRRKDASRYETIRPETRTYYRKQNRAYDAFLLQLLSRGMSQKWFNENALACDLLREQHRRVLIARMHIQKAAEARRAAAKEKRVKKDVGARYS